MPGEAQGLLEGGVRFEGGSGGGGAGCSSDGGGFVGYFLNSRILGMRCARALWARRGVRNEGCVNFKNTFQCSAHIAAASLIPLTEV